MVKVAYNRRISCPPIWKDGGNLFLLPKCVPQRESHPLSGVKHAEVGHSNHIMLASLVLLFGKLNWNSYFKCLSFQVTHFLTLEIFYLTRYIQYIQVSFFGVVLVWGFCMSSVFSFCPSLYQILHFVIVQSTQWKGITSLAFSFWALYFEFQQ